MAVTLQFLADIKNSKQVQDTSKDIIVALVKRQQAMERVCIFKMDKDFEMKSEEATASIEMMMATVDDWLEKMRNLCNTQLTKIYDKQQLLIDENNCLYTDIDQMKSEIKFLKSRNDHIGVTTDTNRGATSPPHENAPRTHSFFERHPIDTTTQDIHPIFTPFKLLHPIGNHHVKEVESYKFQKANLSVTCSGEYNVSIFYNTIRHIVGSFNILIFPLEQITKETVI